MLLNAINFNVNCTILSCTTSCYNFFNINILKIIAHDNFQLYGFLKIFHFFFHFWEYHNKPFCHYTMCHCINCNDFLTTTFSLLYLYSSILILYYIVVKFALDCAYWQFPTLWLSLNFSFCIFFIFEDIIIKLFVII